MLAFADTVNNVGVRGNSKMCASAYNLQIFEHFRLGYCDLATLDVWNTSSRR